MHKSVVSVKADTGGREKQGIASTGSRKAGVTKTKVSKVNIVKVENKI